MLAAVYHGLDDLRVEQVADPDCEPDGLIIRVEACTICGTDVRILTYGQANVQIPQILGHEIAGTVIEVGRQVRGWVPRDRIAIRPGIPCGQCAQCLRGQQNFCSHRHGAFGYSLPGGFAEYLAIPGIAIRTGGVMRVPDTLEAGEAAIFEPLACCINGQEMIGVRFRDRVLIIGAGPIGCMHLLLVRRRGAAHIVAADVLRGRLDLASMFDPDQTVLSSAPDFADRVRVALNGVPDVVIVACSSSEAQEAAIGLAALGGRVLFFAGLPHAALPIRLNSNQVHYKQLALLGATGSTFEQDQLALELLATRMINGQRLVTHRFPFVKISDTFATVRAGKGLKVAIVPHGDVPAREGLGGSHHGDPLPHRN